MGMVMKASTGMKKIVSLLQNCVEDSFDFMVSDLFSSALNGVVTVNRDVYTKIAL